MLGGVVLKRQWYLGRTVGVAGPGSMKVDTKDEDQFMELVYVIEPAASPVLGTHVVEATTRVREAM